MSKTTDTTVEYQTLIEHSTDIICVLDTEGTIEYHNPSFSHSLGYDRQETAGECILEFVHPDDRSQLRECLADTSTAPEDTTRIEHRIETADGDWKWFESRCRQLDQQSETTEQLVVNSRDVTERKREEKRLKQRKKRLDRFASAVSHDLRNPLNVAQGYLDLPGTPTESELSKVETALERADQIIDDLLELTRVPENPEFEPRDLQAVATQAWGLVDTAEANLIVTDTKEIEIIPGWGHQLFENLFRNAVEHGGSDVIVTVEPTANGFNIRDDGKGFADNRRDELLDWGVTTDPAGTGIGLAIVEHIAADHGWNLSVETADLGGAQFSFVLDQ